MILVHDAARPFVTADVIDRAIDGAIAGGAVVPAVPVHDTVKQVAPGDTRVVATLPRETLFLAQTPQAFRRDVLAAAIDAGRAGASGTDEAMLAEQAGHEVRLVAGDDANVKITTAADLERARAISLSDRAAPPAFRIGTGYDLHVFAEGRPLILGGVRIPYDRGLRGHSDADAVCHAVTDAILGAANLGDIGRLFPDTDPRYKDADSLVLLADAAGARPRRRLADRQRRRRGDRRAPEDRSARARRCRPSLAGPLGVDPGAIAIKGKTNEGVDATGRGEALAVHAVALIARRRPRRMIVYGAHAAFEALRAGRATRLSLVARPGDARRTGAPPISSPRRSGPACRSTPISEEQASRLAERPAAPGRDRRGRRCRRSGRRPTSSPRRARRRCSWSSTASRIRTTSARSCAPPTPPASTA